MLFGGWIDVHTPHRTHEDEMNVFTNVCDDYEQDKERLHHAFCGVSLGKRHEKSLADTV